MSRYTSPPDPLHFNQQVWALVRQVPPGKVVTYGQIAGLVAAPPGMHIKDYLAFGARWVGGAMAVCPNDVPWQRVINAQGKISLRQNADKQRELLEAEGVVFNERGRVDLKIYGWSGPSARPGDSENGYELPR